MSQDVYILIYRDGNKETFNPHRVNGVFTSQKALEQYHPELKIEWVEPSTSYLIAGYADGVWVLKRKLVDEMEKA